MSISPGPASVRPTFPAVISPAPASAAPIWAGPGWSGPTDYDIDTTDNVVAGMRVALPEAVSLLASTGVELVELPL